MAWNIVQAYLFFAATILASLMLVLAHAPSRSVDGGRPSFAMLAVQVRILAPEVAEPPHEIAMGSPLALVHNASSANSSVPPA
jgi:hypothetical protein